MSTFIAILEEKYEAELKWPFIGEVTFTLLNQLEDLSINDEVNLRPIKDERDTGAWGYHEFISQSKLTYDSGTNTQYLKDDTLYFSVSVKVANHKPWLRCTLTQTTKTDCQAQVREALS